MTDCVLDLNDMDAITQRISAFLSAEENTAIRKLLAERLPSIKQETCAMWKMVWG